MHEAILCARALQVHRGAVHAVRGVDLAIEAGSCLGLLGPNGAGKTTTIECLEGILRPSAGEVLWRGRPLGDGFAERAGIMFQQTALQDFVTVAETLRLFARLYRRARPLPGLIADCRLGEFLDREPRHLSGGQRQRLLLAIALVGDPQVLFLDEPTTGLDPQARRNLWALVGQVKARGVTVVLTTHYMDEAHELCDRIAIMDHGRVIAEGRPDALLRRTFDDVVMELPVADWPGTLVPADFGATRVKDRVQLNSRDVNHSIAGLLGAGVPLRHLQVRTRDLEDLFIELTGRELRS